MAKIKLHPLFVHISGTMGVFVFKKSRTGEVIVASRPRKSNTEPSEAQKAHRERFKLSVAYARAALADPVVRAIYEDIALTEGMSAFTAAQSDYLRGNDRLSKSS
jgi:hypothetical protein